MDGKEIPAGLLPIAEKSYEEFKFSVTNPVLLNMFKLTSVGVILKGALYRSFLTFKEPKKYLVMDLISLMPTFFINLLRPVYSWLKKPG